MVFDLGCNLCVMKLSSALGFLKVYIHSPFRSERTSFVLDAFSVVCNTIDLRKNFLRSPNFLFVCKKLFFASNCLLS